MIPVADNLVEEVLARIQRKQRPEETPTNSSACSEYQNRMIDSLTLSTQNLFETMCGWKMSLRGIEHACGNRAQHDLSGIISISGKLRMTIVVSLSKELAFSVADALLNHQHDAINGEVIDLVGELTNMICGNAKERFTVEGLSLGLPTVVAGSSMIVAFESGLNISQIAFDSPFGPLSILLGMRG